MGGGFASAFIGEGWVADQRICGAANSVLSCQALQPASASIAARTLRRNGMAIKTSRSPGETRAPARANLGLQGLSNSFRGGAAMRRGMALAAALALAACAGPQWEKPGISAETAAA